MRLHLTSSALALLLPLATSAAAEGPEHVYRENLGQTLGSSLTYTQDWSAAYLKEYYEGVHHVYLVGDGKSGTFHGVLELNCPAPEASKWLTAPVDNSMPENRVPVEAIRGMRRLYCSR